MTGNSKDGKFAGKVAFVTGAAGGLGGVTARLLAQQGATVIIADVAADRGEVLAAAIREAGGQATFTQLDVSSPDNWTSCRESLVRSFGRLDVLVNNAGIVSRVPVREVALEEWKRVLDINLTGSMLGIQALAPLMRDSGGGSIVNVSSTAGIIAYPGVAYSATKWGLRGLTKSAALDLLEWNIRVNSVHPAQVRDTLITDAASPDWINATARIMPMKRQVTAEEVAHAILYLASQESSYVNGSELIVDGGATSLGFPYIRSLLQQESASAP